MFNNKLITLLLVSCIFSTQSFAAPSIVSVDYSLNKINISGQDFGVKQPAAPLLWDNFEYGNNLDGLGSFPNWAAYGGVGGYISTDSAYSGTRSAYNRITPSNGAGFNTSYYSFAPVPVVYYTYRTRLISSGDSYGQFKNGRTGSGSNRYSGSGVSMISDGYVGRYLDNGVFQSFASQEDLSGRSQYLSNMRSSSWNRHELYRKAGNGDGLMWFASGTDRREYRNLSNVSTLSGSVILGLMWANARNDGDHRIYIDDVYVDNTQTRVELCAGSTWASRTSCDPQIPSAWSSTSINVTVNTGSFIAGQAAYLYVVDANGDVNATGYPITIGANTGGTTPPPADNTPSITISSPTSSSTFTTSTSAITIAGTTSDDKGIASVTWTSTLGGSGTATNVSGTWSNWQIANLALSQGDNPITVTVTDTAGQKTSRSITITYSLIAQPPPPPSDTNVWDAVSQNGDSTWKSSTVTYTVRLLVKGSALTQGGSQVRLGFQGRSSGSYTIRKVSIAHRDMNGQVGDVVDGTWSRVTFDGQTSATWGSDVVTVPAGQEKFSDPIPFPLMTGVDYYVTFKIDSPAVYLNPPAGYQELYFPNTDRTDDLDWSNNGHSVTQDYHALGSILASGVAPNRPPTPSGVLLVPTK